MPINEIRANVFDIRQDQPDRRDQFLVDTNSWIQLTYSRLITQKDGYAGYIKRALETKSELFCCGVTLIELAGVVEKQEHALYSQAYPHVDLKGFRHDCKKERADVVSEIKSCWRQVEDMAELIDLTLDSDRMRRTVADLDRYAVDGYDFLLLQAMDQRGIRNIITDDADFATIADLNVFTANGHAIALARRQKCLQRRG